MLITFDYRDGYLAQYKDRKRLNRLGKLGMLVQSRIFTKFPTLPKFINHNLLIYKTPFSDRRGYRCPLTRVRANETYYCRFPIRPHDLSAADCGLSR